MYDEIVQAIIQMAKSVTNAKIFLGAIPPDSAIAVVGNPYQSTVYQDIGSDVRVVVSINGKNKNQETIVRQLDAIHAALTRRKDFPAGDLWQIYAIETTAGPRLMGRESSGQWLYASSVTVKVNIKGVS